MLLFISTSFFNTRQRFYVSIHLMLLFILMEILVRGRSACFNTSHVVIYHFLRLFFLFLLPGFQYISCCYLSYPDCKLRHLVHLFQYISCCYLSISNSEVAGTENLFQYISCCYLSRFV